MGRDPGQGGSLKKKIVLLGVSMLAIMAGTAISPTLPAIEDAFAGSPRVEFLVPLVLTVTALGVVVTAPFAGVVVDRFGRKRTLIFSLGLYGVSGISGVWVDSLGGLLLGRGILGVAVGGIMTCIPTLVADYFKGAEREKFMGLQAAFMGFSGVVCIVVGGILADVGWRAPFFLFLAAFLVLPGAAFILHEPSREERADPAAARPGGTGKPWGTILLLYSLGFVEMVVLYFLPVKLPFHLTELFGSSATEVGVAIGCAILVSAVVSLFYGRVRLLLSYQGIFAVQFLFIALGYGVLTLAGSYGGVILGLAISGLGFGLMVPNMNVWLAEIAPAHARGRLFGGLTSCFYVGQFVSPLVAHPLIPEGVSGGTARIYGFGAAASALMGLAFLCAILFGPED